MKQKFLLSLVFVCTCIVSSQAQINKGATWLGGSIGYSQYKEDYGTSPDYKSTNLSFSPVIGKVVKDNLVVGIGLTYFKNNLKNSGSITDQKERQLGGVVFIRQYFPIISRIYIFGEASAAFRNIKGDAEQVYYNGNNMSSVNTKTKGWESGLSITPGISVAINKRLQLETGFNNLLNVFYSKRNTTSAVRSFERRTDQLTAGLSLENESQFFLGFRFLINNK